MKNLFPLQLSASDTLLSKNSLLSGAIATTEAWLNFQTMGLDWFGDEDRSPRFRYRFVSHDELTQQCNDGLNWQKSSPTDAFICQNDGLNCLILIALNNDDINHDKQVSIENILREQLVIATNERAKELSLTQIHI